MPAPESPAARTPSPIGPLAITVALALPILGLVLSRRQPPAETPRPAGDQPASAHQPSDPEPYGGPTDPAASGQPLPSVGAPQATAGAAPAIIRQHTADKPTWFTVTLPPGWIQSAETQPSARLRSPGEPASAGQAPQEPIAFVDMQASVRPIALTADPSAEGELTEDTVQVDGVTATRSLRRTEGSDMLAVKGQASTGAHFLFTGRVVGPRGPAFDERRAELDAALASVAFVPDHVSGQTWVDDLSDLESGLQIALRHPSDWQLTPGQEGVQTLSGPSGRISWTEISLDVQSHWDPARPLGLGDTVFGREARLQREGPGEAGYVVKLDGGAWLSVGTTADPSTTGEPDMAALQTLWYILRWSSVTEDPMQEEPAYP